MVKTPGHFATGKALSVLELSSSTIGSYPEFSPPLTKATECPGPAKIFDHASHTLLSDYLLLTTSQTLVETSPVVRRPNSRSTSGAGRALDQRPGAINLQYFRFT